MNKEWGMGNGGPKEGQGTKQTQEQRMGQASKQGSKQSKQARNPVKEASKEWGGTGKQAKNGEGAPEGAGSRTRDKGKQHKGSKQGPRREQKEQRNRGKQAGEQRNRGTEGTGSRRVREAGGGQGKQVTRGEAISIRREARKCNDGPKEGKESYGERTARENVVIFISMAVAQWTNADVNERNLPGTGEE